MKKKSIVVSVLSLIMTFCISCSTDNMIVNEPSNNSQPKEIEFSEQEYKVLGNISKPNKIGMDDAINNISNYSLNNGTRSEGGELKEIGVLTKAKFGTIADSISAILPDTLAYVLYSEQNGTYTIASADNRIENPILAILNDNILDGEDAEKKLMVLETLVQYVYWGIRNYESAKDETLEEILNKINMNESGASTRAQDNPGYTEDDLLVIDYEIGGWYLTDYVDKMIPVEWGQGAPYNEKVKNKKSCGTVPVGCVATAVAQVAAFWHYPTSINGITLNWNQLTSNKKINANETSKVNQVSTLMKAIGEGSDMDYDCNASRSRVYKGRNWLQNHGYIDGSERSYNYSDVVTSLKSGCPVLAEGFRELENYVLFSITDHGHAWVIDGFAVNERKRRRQVYVKKDKITGQQVLLSDNIYTEKSKTLHNNWGWNGSYNGWFPEGCFDSHNASKRSSTITRGTDGNYQYNRKIYINLRH